MKLQRLLKLLDGCTDVEQRKAFLEVSLAVELAYALALPSSAVDSVVAHFEQFHAESVKRVIGEVNELYPLSVNVTYNMVVDAYKNRYVICHEPTLLTSSDIAAQLARPAFEQSVTPQHLAIIEQQYGALLRKDLCDFIGRFIV